MWYESGAEELRENVCVDNLLKIGSEECVDGMGSRRVRERVFVDTIGCRRVQ